MKRLNQIIVFMIIIIILIIITLFLLIKQYTNLGITDEEQVSIDIEEVFENENKIQLIETKAEYFNIKKCIDTYSSYSNELLNNKKTEDKLLSIIPNFVKEELKLSATNVYNEVGIPNKIIRIDSIYKSLQTISKEAYEENTNICAYIAKGYFIDKNTFVKEELKIIILLDINNSTFLVIPQKYIEQKGINIENNINFTIYNEEAINANQYNTFTYSTATAEDMSKEYFSRFKTSLTYDLEYIYNCLDNEYKEKRFGSYDKFKEYAKNNLNKIEFNKYLVNYSKEYIEYVCQDQYENLYIFKETSPMNFTLKLDSYTIATEKYKTEYESATEQVKVMMNIDKWIQMLNSRDYTAAYNHLDTTFRNNKFGSQEKFEANMKKDFSSYYKIEFLDASSQANLYIQEIKLTDIMNEKKTKTLTIIMQLKEDMDFVMSFNIK